MNVVIFGANGMLGSYLTSYLSKDMKVIPMTRKELDISKTDESKIRSKLDFIGNNDVIINAAGIIKHRQNYNTKEMILVNSMFPHILSDVKAEKNCNVIHITTDCVFSGNYGGYIETDKHDCTDEYGKTKSLGENPEITIIRTSIIGQEKQNKKSLLEWVRSNKDGNINGYENHFWNGITCLEFAKLAKTIIEKEMYWKGVMHVHSPDTMSKFELVSEINSVYDLGIIVTPVQTEKECDRSLGSIYSDIKITKTISEQIKETMEYSL